MPWKYHVTDKQVNFSYVAINIQTIPGKFGGENVCLLWQITLFKRLAEKSMANE